MIDLTDVCWVPAMGKIYILKSWLWEQFRGSRAGGNTRDRGLYQEATSIVLARDIKDRGQKVWRRKKQVQLLHVELGGPQNPGEDDSYDLAHRLGGKSRALKTQRNSTGPQSTDAI